MQPRLHVHGQHRNQSHREVKGGLTMFWLIIWDAISEPLLDLLNTCPTEIQEDNKETTTPKTEEKD